MQGIRRIDTLSFTALYLETWYRSRGEADDLLLGPATGFLVGVPGDYWLVTAWHVLSGRRSDTGAVMSKTGLRPDYVRVRFASQENLAPIHVDYPLYTDASQDISRFRSPADRRIDVAALHIGAVPGTAVDAPLGNTWPTLRELHPRERRLQLGSEADAPIPLRVTDRLFVLGFPFGDTGSWPFAVWTVAPVASEPLARWNGLPGFLLDSRTREGQSGSPVLMHIRPGEPVVAGGVVHLHEESVTALVGIYSGRLDPNSDLGMVWTTDALFGFLPEIAPPDWAPPPAEG
ncbi:trypsin-like peptidase domain-containing protein [Streptomyces sp. MC1]|uniref:trypsin-like peptidase domain-containing protein n=1 Tax=Streptomyces sp. MC1 TaxID=295105 RepID=UPI0018C9B9DE|nr:trypsin-like peptidase domain-containing protein [Streptomyces sp. MC1]MBG7701305.1 trypsin-like peptidase domain-containing protein [Streptomyces sp. MC1]